MQEKSFLGLSPAGFHRVVYSEWTGTIAYTERGPGPERHDAGAMVVCVHGMVRNGRDFDFLAERLSRQHGRAVCPDVVGRGRSDWLPVPALYGYPQYLADMTALIARLDVPQVDWVGTSMGGLIGMMLAAQPNTPIRRLVINDAGAFVPKAALERIGGYVGADPSFADVDELEAYLRQIYAPFGALTDEQWRHMAVHSARPVAGGRVGLAYDPGIGHVFRNPDQPVEDVDLWPIWDAVRCPVLLIRGEHSDVLPRDVAEEMTRRGPGATLVEIAGCGHAPSLMTADQAAIVQDFLHA